MGLQISVDKKYIICKIKRPKNSNKRRRTFRTTVEKETREIFFNKLKNNYKRIGRGPLTYDDSKLIISPRKNEKN